MKNLCPKCGSNVFKGWIKKPGAFRINEDGKIEILKEGSKFATEIVECAKCNEKLTQDDLVEKIGKACSKCGNLFEEEELTNGLCPVCYAKENRKDIANASKEELIAMLLKAEKESATAEKPKRKRKTKTKEESDEKVKEEKLDEKPEESEEPQEISIGICTPTVSEEYSIEDNQNEEIDNIEPNEPSEEIEEVIPDVPNEEQNNEVEGTEEYVGDMPADTMEDDSSIVLPPGAIDDSDPF